MKSNRIYSGGTDLHGGAVEQGASPPDEMLRWSFGSVKTGKGFWVQVTATAGLQDQETRNAENSHF